MKRMIVAIRDRAAVTFGQPFLVVARGQAIRMFSDAINNSRDPDNAMFHHPEDFDLYELGEFEDSDGRITPNEIPVQIAVGKDLKQV